MAQLQPTAAAHRSILGALLSTDGIASTAPILAPQTLRELNAALDEIFAAQYAKARAYATIDDIVRLGLLDAVVGGTMRRVLLTILPDPVLYHAHVYEIAANATTPHIFAETMAGWHRDPDSEYTWGHATHVSVFVYLTDIGPESGPFEFLPSLPTDWIGSRTPAISVTGAAGYSFAWNRAYFHRAAPNRSAVRRRLLKLSIQPNNRPSAHLTNENFRAASALVPPGDPYIDLLFGRYQHTTPPVLPASVEIEAARVAPTRTIGIADRVLAEAQARAKVREARRWLKQRLTGSRNESVAYD